MSDAATMTGPLPTPPSNSFRPISRWQKLLGFRLLWPLVALCLLLFYNAAFTTGFFQIELRDGHLYGSLIDVLALFTPVAIIAIGMTLVIATGGVDLSVGSTVAISGSLAAVLVSGTPIELYGWTMPVSPHSFFPAAIIALFVSLIIGLINGVLVSTVRIQPIIATLIMMVAGRGIAQKITGGQKINFADDWFVHLGNGYFAYLPFGVTLVVITFVIVAIATRQTALGLALESVGDSPSASRYVGLRVKTIQIAAYAICGLCAGIAGLVVASRVKQGDPIIAGASPPIELDAIFAVVVGGTALAGGRFTLLGSMLGAILLQTLGTTLLSTKFNGADFRPDLLPMPKAIVIIVVCLMQSVRFRETVLKPFRSK